MPYRDPTQRIAHARAWRMKQRALRQQARPLLEPALQREVQKLLQQERRARTQQDLALLVRPLCRLVGQLVGVREGETDAAVDA
jgi:hypothetical protein